MYVSHWVIRYRCGCSRWLHRYVFSSVSISVELMSQDTYSLSYGNFIPDVAFSCRLPGFLYHIMIPSALPRHRMYPPTWRTPTFDYFLLIFATECSIIATEKLYCCFFVCFLGQGLHHLQNDTIKMYIITTPDFSLNFNILSSLKFL